MGLGDERADINHGHNRWDGTRWAPEYYTWCPSCRSAQPQRPQPRPIRYERPHPRLHSTVYDTRAPENVFDPDGGRYVVTCDEHHTLVNVDYLYIAEEVARDRTLFCGGCNGDPAYA